MRLILIQYTFSILFTDAALDFISVAPPGDATAEDMRIYYGSVYQSTQTLFRSLLGQSRASTKLLQNQRFTVNAFRVGMT